MHIHAQSRAERSEMEQSSVEERQHFRTPIANSDFDRTVAPDLCWGNDSERKVPPEPSWSYNFKRTCNVTTTCNVETTTLTWLD